MNKKFRVKSAFTLAETIMTLAIIGLVITAAIPMITKKNTRTTVATDTPWTTIVGNNMGMKLANDSYIVIGNSTPMIYDTDNAAYTKAYNLTINNATAADSLYDIFKSDIRTINIAGYRFTEYSPTNTLTISPKDCNYLKNTVIIGDDPLVYETGDRDRTKDRQLIDSVFIGNTNHIDAATAGSTSLYSNIYIGNNINTAQGSNRLVFGEGFSIYSNRDGVSNQVVIGSVILSNRPNSLAIGGWLIDAKNTIGYESCSAGTLTCENDFVIAMGNSVPFITAKANSGVTSSDVKFHGDIDLPNPYDIAANTTITTTSDIRLKNIKGPYTKGLKEILQINPVIFTYKSDKAKSLNTGVIAQDLQKVFPEAVTTMPDGYLGIDTTPVFFAAANALKEINEKTEKEKIRHEKLQKELNQLEQDLANIKPTLWQRIINFIKNLFKISEVHNV